MKYYTIKNINGKEKGLFAAKDISKGDIILKVNFSSKRAFTLNEIANHPKRHSEHWDYVGRGKYVLDFSPYSFVNHSCEPNCATKYHSITKKSLVALRDIKKGEQLTYDYSASAIDQFGGKGFWKFRCRCGAKNCRKMVTGDFFKLPKCLQRKYWKFLPASFRKKYKNLM
ncbi:SET domain-containing protein [Candidatus Woesearchaeota archaeon]|nr:SET domain-containing protein [Candidatus Woesearchaeota archaeon]